MKPMTIPKWRIKRGQASVRWNNFELKLDVSHPATGIELTHPSSPQTQSPLAAPGVIVLPHERLDPFERGGDLIVAYPCTAERIFGGELSWRVRSFPTNDPDDDDAELDREVVEQMKSDENGFEIKIDSESTIDEPFQAEVVIPNTLTVELVYSTETLLLDTYPQKHLVSRLTGDEIEFFAESAGRLVACDRLAKFVACLVHNNEISSLVTVMPSDLIGCSVSLAQESGLQQVELDWKLSLDFLEKGVIRRFRAMNASGPDRQTLLDAAAEFFSSEIPLTA